MIFLVCFNLAMARVLPKTAYLNMAARIAYEEKIPVDLFKAIVKKESRWNPFAIYGGKRGYHFANKSEAMKKVIQLRQAGRKNINVGMMQVNLQHHKKYSAEQLLDPECNLRYGARYLKKLHRQFGSWRTAVGYFHAGGKTRRYTAYIRNLSCSLPN